MLVDNELIELATENVISIHISFLISFLYKHMYRVLCISKYFSEILFCNRVFQKVHCIKIT